VRVSSSVSAARDAVEGFAAVNVDQHPASQATTVGSATIASVLNGATAADRVLEDVATLISSVKEQAGKVTTLAATMEARDAHDAGALAAGRVI
jgi:hypothetical protein